MKMDEVDRAELSFFSRIQRLLVAREKKRLPVPTRRICGVDASYRDRAVVAAATHFIDGKSAERRIYRGRYTFPYVRGLFYLHEGPFAVAAVERLSSKPQLVCFDAHGLAHPRSAGLATICGMTLGTPSIGIAKSALIGTVRSSGGGIEEVVYRGAVVGFMSDFEGRARYWSPGFSVSIGRLRWIIENYGLICLRALAESDRLSRREIKKWRSSEHPS